MPSVRLSFSMKHVEVLYVKALQFPVCRQCEPQSILEMPAYPKGSRFKLMLLQGKNISAGIPEPREYWIKSQSNHIEIMANYSLFRNEMKNYLDFEEVVPISSRPHYSWTSM